MRTPLVLPLWRWLLDVLAAGVAGALVATACNGCGDPRPQASMPLVPYCVAADGSTVDCGPPPQYVGPCNDWCNDAGACAIPDNSECKPPCSCPGGAP